MRFALAALALALPLCLGLPAAAGGPAAPTPAPVNPMLQPVADQGISGVWTGTYYYGNRPPVPFTLYLNERGGRVSGQSREPATFGDGTSEVLIARIKGRRTGDTFTFTKTYNGTGGVNHAVQYTAQIARDGMNMEGYWETGNTTGGFEAQRE
jgi:hypothetical protein